MRHTRGTGAPSGATASKIQESVCFHFSSGKGVRKPRDPAANDRTGGMGPSKSDAAHVSVPSPPIVTT
eukprot:4425962-Pyramimonas_sp.AAC.1